MSKKISGADVLANGIVAFFITLGFAFCISGLVNDNNSDYIIVGVTVILATITGHYTYTTKKILEINEKSVDFLIDLEMKKQIEMIFDIFVNNFQEDIVATIKNLKTEVYIDYKNLKYIYKQEIFLPLAFTYSGHFKEELSFFSIDEKYPEEVFQRHIVKIIKLINEVDSKIDNLTEVFLHSADDIYKDNASFQNISIKNDISKLELLTYLYFHSKNSESEFHFEIDEFGDNLKNLLGIITPLSQDLNVKQSIIKIQNAEKDLLLSLKALNDELLNLIKEWSIKYHFFPRRWRHKYFESLYKNSE